MGFEQLFLLLLLVAVFGLFIWGRWRYDVVAFAALLVAAVAGVVPFADTFSGFGHPATVTVALALVISRGFQNAGRNGGGMGAIPPCEARRCAKITDAVGQGV